MERMRRSNRVEAPDIFLYTDWSLFEFHRLRERERERRVFVKTSIKEKAERREKKRRWG